MMPLFSLPRHAAKAAAPAARAAAVGSNSLNGMSCRQYNFASTEYKKAFGGLPIADGDHPPPLDPPPRPPTSIQPITQPPTLLRVAKRCCMYPC